MKRKETKNGLPKFGEKYLNTKEQIIFIIAFFVSITLIITLTLF